MKNKTVLIFFLFAAACVATGFAGGINDSIFNNFLNSKFSISAELRGLLELPREAPGFIIVFLAFSAFYFLGDLRLAIVANVIFGIGLLGMGYYTHSYPLLCVWLFVASSGQHIYMPLSSLIAVSVSEGKNVGKVMGQFMGLSTIASICGFGVVFLGFKFFHMSFALAYTIAAGAALISVIFFFFMRRNVEAVPPKSRIVLKKRYSLFYVLSVLYGARKQIFITFAPWVIIKVFGANVEYFAALGFIGNLIAVFFRPLLGRLIDRLGERWILRAEALLMVVVCIFYAFSGRFGGVGLYVASACYIVDLMMMSVTMARVMYVKKIAEDETDVSPTVAMGVSIDHIIAMTIPFIGGLMWELYGFWVVFAAGAVISAVNAVVAGKIRVPQVDTIAND